MATPAYVVPRRKESYTTWLYLGFAVIVMFATLFGLWYAAPR